MHADNLLKEETSDKEVTAWGRQGEAFRMQCNYSRAITCFDKALEEQPSSAWLYAHRGAVKGALADLEGALKDFDKAVELKGGKYPWVLAQKGEAYRIYVRDHQVYLNLPQIFEHIDKTLRAFDEALGEMPKNAWLYAHRGAAYTFSVWVSAINRLEPAKQSTEAQNANADLKKALELAPDYTWPLRFRAFLLSITGNYHQASDGLRAAIAANPNKEAYISKAFSIVACHAGAFEDAESLAWVAADNYPDDPLVKYWISVAVAKQNLPCSPMLISHARRRLKYGANMVHAALGGLDALEGNLEDAKEALRRLRENVDAETLSVMAHDPAWDSLRETQEYKDLFQAVLEHQ